VPSARLDELSVVPLGEQRQLVHERDARGEHRIGRVLGELGRADVHHLQALVVALAQAAADVAAERAAAGEEAPPGGGRLELWLLDAAKVGAEAAATAARLCPGLRVGLPREPQWPHEGDCTAECSLQCSARIDWAELGQ
jgi:hypothetical protein